MGLILPAKLTSFLFVVVVRGHRERQEEIWNRQIIPHTAASAKNVLTGVNGTAKHVTSAITVLPFLVKLANLTRIDVEWMTVRR